jgi:hypothetical protein
VSHDLLSAAEEIALAKRIERGDLKAKERMIESNLRLVVAVARAYGDSGVPFADLVQEGTVGLVRALRSSITAASGGSRRTRCGGSGARSSTRSRIRD